MLYKTKWGVRLINSVGKKYKKTLKTLSYISISIGYILMLGILYLFGKIIWIYLFKQNIVQAIKVPPIMPLIPYLPQAFKLDYLPPFYFTYWILIIAIIAITHEFAHGIFAVRNKIKIKKTGFGFFPFFLPIFLAAFVELDEKQMAKKRKFSQLAVLSAGTFANVLTAILFFLILAVFFSLAFTPAGIMFDDYFYIPMAIGAITSVNNVSLENHTYEEFVSLVNTTGQNQAVAEGKGYAGVGFFMNTNQYVKLYPDAPAINAKLESVILKINGVETKTKEVLTQELSKYSPGDIVTLNVPEEDGGNYNRDIVLEENPYEPKRAWLGIAFFERADSGITGKIYSLLTSFKKPHVYYAPKINGLSIFVYNLIWWVVLISISVALINMLPVGIFDGGRFFFLTALVLTKSERKAKKAFAFVTKLILFLVLLLMVFWFIGVF